MHTHMLWWSREGRGRWRNSGRKERKREREREKRMCKHNYNGTIVYTFSTVYIYVHFR